MGLLDSYLRWKKEKHIEQEKENARELALKIILDALPEKYKKGEIYLLEIIQGEPIKKVYSNKKFIGTMELKPTFNSSTHPLQATFKEKNKC
jgi:hypothetical protein